MEVSWGDGSMLFLGRDQLFSWKVTCSWARAPRLHWGHSCGWKVSMEGLNECGLAWKWSGDRRLPSLTRGFGCHWSEKRGVRWGTGGDRSLWKAKKLQSKVNLYLYVFLQNKDNFDGVSTSKARAGGINLLQGTLISYDSLTWTILVSGAV